MTESSRVFAEDLGLPPLPLAEWEDSKETLHRYAQVIGKIRLRYTPFMNHWWHVTLYVSAHGLTTGPIPYGDGSFEISPNLLENRLVVRTSEGTGFDFDLENLSVAEFYRRLVEGLGGLGITVSIDTSPFDLPDAQNLDENTLHRVCEREYVRRYHQVLVWVDATFKEFAGRFNGKQSPVHLFWHSFDLTVTRFSNRRVEQPADVDPVTREAYSHEVISFGFWPGDRQTREPTFYSYTAPEPAGLTAQPLHPKAASWTPEGGTALLTYEAVRKGESPRNTLLDFMQSAYEAGATTAGWDVDALQTNPRAHSSA